MFGESYDKHRKNIPSVSEYLKTDSSVNNGGSTDYYKIKQEWKDCQDIIEHRNMNFSQGNIFKAAFTFNLGRHEATNYRRELNKIKYFADREIERLDRENA